jgi:hypothetical protein
MTSSKMRIVNTLIVIDIGIIIFCMLAGNRSWLISSQVGYFSSLLVVLASLVSYKNMVKSSADNSIVIADNDKTLEEIEDPHGLYDDEDYTKNIVNEAEEDEPKRPAGESLKHSKASLSLYRLGAYAILIFGFMILSSEHMLHLPSYIFGIFIAPIITVGMIFFGLKRQKD